MGIDICIPREALQELDEDISDELLTDIFRTPYIFRYLKSSRVDFEERHENYVIFMSNYHIQHEIAFNSLFTLC